MGHILNVVKSTSVVVDQNGEVLHSTEELIEDKRNHFSVKRLNARYWQEADFLIAKNLTGNEHFLLALCKIHLDDTFTMNFTMKQLSKAGDVSIATAKRFIRKMLEMGVVISPRRGRYHFNPFIFSVKQHRTNEAIQTMQDFWIAQYGEPITQGDLALMEFPTFVRPEVIAEHLNPETKVSKMNLPKA